MTQRITCRIHENCSAPLCPLYMGEKGLSGIWYPDEGVCRKSRNIASWIRLQRKIAKRVTPDNVGYYFSFAMLKVPFRVTKKVIGLDPELDVSKEPRQLRAWKKHNKAVKRRKRSSKVVKKKAIKPEGEAEVSRWPTGTRGPPEEAGDASTPIE